MRLAPLAIIAVFAVASPALAAPAGKTATDVSAQSRQRPPASITVRPLRRAHPYRSGPSLYPLPYSVDYPGPRGVRHCSGAYVFEARASGTVVVPRMRCWWSQG